MGARRGNHCYGLESADACQLEYAHTHTSRAQSSETVAPNVCLSRSALESRSYRLPRTHSASCEHFIEHFTLERRVNYRTTFMWHNISRKYRSLSQSIIMCVNYRGMPDWCAMQYRYVPSAVAYNVFESHRQRQSIMYAQTIIAASVGYCCCWPTSRALIAPIRIMRVRRRLVGYRQTEWHIPDARMLLNWSKKQIQFHFACHRIRIANEFSLLALCCRSENFALDLSNTMMY